VVSPTNSTIIKRSTVSNRFLLWVQAAFASQNVRENRAVSDKLKLAGFDHPAAPIFYIISRVSLAIGLPLLAIGGGLISGRPLAGFFGTIMLPMILCGVGLLAPHWIVTRLGASRRAQMENEFPDALDLLVVCVEAGLSLEAAFVRVASEVSDSHPRICEEFSILADELSAGRGRAEALRALAERVSVDNVTSFVALLVQSEALGVSVAQSLRTYSGEMRESRFMKAEEKAMRIPVLMTMPIVACFMPVIIVALLLPPAIDVVRTLLPTLEGTGGAAAHSALPGPPRAP
jgi:tight adherence protein C